MPLSTALIFQVKGRRRWTWTWKFRNSPQGKVVFKEADRICAGGLTKVILAGLLQTAR